MTQFAANMKSDIRRWWADFPMTYGLEHGTTAYDASPDPNKIQLGSKQFFEKADETFYSWNDPLHTERGHFAKIFPYDRYCGKKVLEVGCGMGCMAMNWAQQGARITAVDLNPTSIKQTTRRFELFGLEGNIQEADGETLPFEDNTFDYAYSWGVLHHTPGTIAAITELFRVLKPGGEVGVMLYSRNSLLGRYIISYIEGIVNMEEHFLSETELMSRYSDGDRREGNPYTWPVTKREIVHEVFPQFNDLKVEVLGTDTPWILDHWYPGLGSRLLPRAFVKAIARRWGWSLWITGRKRG